MSQILKPGSSLEIFEKVKNLLRQGQVIGLPTETVYGLAADATNGQAVATVFALKARPSFNPLICHFAKISQVLEHCLPHPAFEALAQQFWPGPLTLILKRKASSPINPLVSAGLDTLAVRIPDHPIALEVIERVARPIAAPSANPSEALSPTHPFHVLKAFKNDPLLPLILDGGPCKVGLESTVIDLTQEQPVILRPGAVSIDDLRNILGHVDVFKSGEKTAIRAPGMMKRHYAPSIPLRINSTTVSPQEALLAFGKGPIPKGSITSLNLSIDADLIQAASNLFDMLHALDQPQYSGIAVMPIPNEGIGTAINDRLQRASTHGEIDSVPQK